MDSQMVELAGRHWLTSQLLRADLEVALPERDRGIDLIVYADLDLGGHPKPAINRHLKTGN